MNTDKNLLNAINEIKNIIVKLNKEFFNSELPEIPVFLTPNLRKISCFSSNTITVYNRRESVNGHINLSDYILSLPIEDVCTELLHDMIHQYCYIHNIKDLSRGGQYHNKKFRIIAEQHGLIVGYNKKNGWEMTSASQELIDFVAKNFDRNYSLNIFRYVDNKVCSRNDNKNTVYIPGNNSVRYICPKCGSIARKTDRRRIGCWECGIEMICTTPALTSA